VLSAEELRELVAEMADLLLEAWDELEGRSEGTWPLDAEVIKALTRYEAICRALKRAPAEWRDRIRAAYAEELETATPEFMEMSAPMGPGHDARAELVARLRAARMRDRELAGLMSSTWLGVA
jgi:hypothetical protein